MAPCHHHESENRLKSSGASYQETVLPLDYRMMGQLLEAIIIFKAVEFERGYLWGWLTGPPYARDLLKQLKVLLILPKRTEQRKHSVSDERTR